MTESCRPARPSRALRPVFGTLLAAVLLTACGNQQVDGQPTTQLTPVAPTGASSAPLSSLPPSSSVPSTPSAPATVVPSTPAPTATGPTSSVQRYFTVTIPARWFVSRAEPNNVTCEDGSGTTGARVYIARTGQFPANELDALARAAAKGLSRAVGTQSVGAIRTLTIDGAPARSYNAVVINSKGTKVGLVQTSTVHDGYRYLITAAVVYSKLTTGLPQILSVVNSLRWR